MVLEVFNGTYYYDHGIWRHSSKQIVIFIYHAIRLLGEHQNTQHYMVEVVETHILTNAQHMDGKYSYIYFDNKRITKRPINTSTIIWKQQSKLRATNWMVVDIVEIEKDNVEENEHNITLVNFSRGSVAQFYGDNNISFSYSPLLNIREFSISLWVKVVNITDYYTNFVKTRYGRTGFAVQTHLGKYNFYLGFSGSSPEYIQIRTTTDVVDAWMHITATNSRDEAIIYVNGVRENSGTTTNFVPVTNTSTPYVVSSGQFNNDIGNSYLYDLRQYTRVLTTSEISKIYSHSEILGDEVLHLPFHDKTNITQALSNFDQANIATFDGTSDYIETPHLY